MFLGLLNDQEKKAFSVLAQWMIEADDIVVGEETTAIAALRREMGLPPEATRDERDSDADFSVDEESFITAVAHEMDFPPADLQHLEDWVRQHVRHVAVALALISG